VSLSEFSLIHDCIDIPATTRGDVDLAIGDDCALLRVPHGMLLAVSIDTLVAGRHFVDGVAAASLGHKALAVNLSDLAAMGAEPAWATLALTMPQADSRWLREFMRGFYALAERFGVQLVGGDTTRGPLAITVQAHGFVAPQRVMRRDGARPGDLVYVTGTLGDAGLALQLQQQRRLDAHRHRLLQQRLDRPTPRVAEGMRIAALATAAIDISDGLVSDLGHIVQQSRCGATIELPRLPCSAAVREAVELSAEWSLPLSAGDDYELCFTIPAHKRPQLQELQELLQTPLTQIGSIDEQPGIRCITADGETLAGKPGYDHFL
jgi:thiamine-monophosphate kinase